MEASLLKAFDAVVRQRASTRSEVLRDLARAEVTRAEVADGSDAVAALTLVYDHHVRDLTERLTELQHALGERVRSTMHVHLDPVHCLEVVVLQGRSDELRAFADRVFATRGVMHGGIEIIATTKTKRDGLHVHVHAHDHDHEHHDHDHDHDHDHGHDHDHHHDHGAHTHGHREREPSPSPKPQRKAPARAKRERKSSR